MTRRSSRFQSLSPPGDLRQIPVEESRGTPLLWADHLTRYLPSLLIFIPLLINLAIIAAVSPTTARLQAALSVPHPSVPVQPN